MQPLPPPTASRMPLSKLIDFYGLHKEYIFVLRKQLDSYHKHQVSTVRVVQIRVTPALVSDRFLSGREKKYAEKLLLRAN